MNISPKEIFEIMNGRWTVERRVVPSKGEPMPTIIGTAKFKLQDKNWLIYSEDFILGETVRGQRSYKYYLDPESESITKFFEDGSLLYNLSVTQEQVCGEHPCNKDMYYSKYFFHSKDLFEINYSVVGPHKNYTIYSQYQRRA